MPTCEHCGLNTLSFPFCAATGARHVGCPDCGGDGATPFCPQTGRRHDKPPAAEHRPEPQQPSASVQQERAQARRALEEAQRERERRRATERDVAGADELTEDDIVQLEQLGFGIFGPDNPSLLRIREERAARALAGAAAGATAATAAAAGEPPAAAPLRGMAAELLRRKTAARAEMAAASGGERRKPGAAAATPQRRQQLDDHVAAALVAAARGQPLAPPKKAQTVAPALSGIAGVTWRRFAVCMLCVGLFHAWRAFPLLLGAWSGEEGPASEL